MAPSTSRRATCHHQSDRHAPQCQLAVSVVGLLSRLSYSYLAYSIDDVEDDSVLRRGVPAAHHLFGLPQTINCANYVYFLALDEIIKLKNPEMVKIYTGMCSTSLHPSLPWCLYVMFILEELVNLHRGQGNKG